MPITNQKMQTHMFLTEMYEDEYFPDFLVDKCKQIFVSLCEQIESSKPADTVSLFKLTHAAVESINQLVTEFEENDSEGIDRYSEKALARIWKAQRFSWWMTMLLHRFPDNIPYDDRLQQTDLDYLFSSKHALRSLAENYVGLPF